GEGLGGWRDTEGARDVGRRLVVRVPCLGRGGRARAAAAQRQHAGGDGAVATGGEADGQTRGSGRADGERQIPERAVRERRKGDGMAGARDGQDGRDVASPACDAVSVQEPAPSRVTVPPATEHAPLAANVTGRPEDAVAVTPKGGWPYERPATSWKEVVWGIRRGVARTTWLVDAPA